MNFLYSFLVGGAICGIIQIFIDKTKITPAKLLTLLVVIGCALGFLRVYKPFAEFAGAGATVPISGFGYILAQGAMEYAQKEGVLGAIKGGLIDASSGVAAVIFFSLLFALIFKPHRK